MLTKVNSMLTTSPSNCRRVDLWAFRSALFWGECIIKQTFTVRRSAFGGAVRTSVTLMGQDIGNICCFSAWFDFVICELISGNKATNGD